MSKKFRLPKVLKADLWDWSRKLLLVAAVMFVAMLLMRSVFYVIAFISLMLLADVVALIQLAFARTKVKNEFHQPIFVVKPGETYYGAEGVRVYNTVFGLVDGAHIVIKENCDIRFKAFFSSAIAKVLPPDESWNSLFEIECQSFDIKQPTWDVLDSNQ